MPRPTTRSRRRRSAAVAVGLSLLAISACTTGNAATVATATPTQTSTPAPTVSVQPTPTGGLGPGPDGVDITVPPDGVAAVGPIVVLVHGGAWVAGSPALMDDWATALAAEGSVVFNASYALVGQPRGGYPGSVDDVACAVRFARAEAPAYTDSDQLVIVGHSAGGHLAAVVSLDPDAWGGDCAYPPAAPADRLVGLAGIYDIRAMGGLFGLFVGGSADDVEARLSTVNPVELAGHQDGLEVVLVTGAEDELVLPSQAANFAAALPDGARLVEIPGADHNELQDPTTVGVDVVLGK